MSVDSEQEKYPNEKVQFDRKRMLSDECVPSIRPKRSKAQIFIDQVDEDGVVDLTADCEEDFDSEDLEIAYHLVDAKRYEGINYPKNYSTYRLETAHDLFATKMLHCICTKNGQDEHDGGIEYVYEADDEYDQSKFVELLRKHG
jgi:hypothetical protein